MSGGPFSLEFGDYVLSDAPERIDVDFVCSALAKTYWAENRTRTAVETSLRNSVSFGVYEKKEGRQVAFARVVTDEATFSWLCDVVVDERHRKKGLGKFIMASVLAHPRLKGTRFLLGTRDAHGLYERYGFVRYEAMRREQPRP
jgi:GNAT superfamily N-acetyltransferase